MRRPRFAPALVAALISQSMAAAAGQDSLLAPAAVGPAREIAFHAGMFMAPAEIGRDVNAAGGDVLVARLGDTGAFGVQHEIRTRFIGGAVNVFVLQSVEVQNEAGVEFPYHGKSPLLYAWEVRLYPFSDSISEGQVSPYLAAGFGGALISVDLDNINDQELRHLWARSLSAGVKMLFNGNETFVDVQVKTWFLSGRGPIVPFQASAIVIGLGGRY